MPQFNASGEVRAAGGVVVRFTAEAPLVLLVHRPAFDDWSMPKGKTKPGELDEQAATREVAEETGLELRAEAEIGCLHYADGKGRRKCTRYWLMRAEAEPVVTREVDRFEWLPASLAARRVTRVAEGKLLSQLAPRLLVSATELACFDPIVVWEDGAQ